MSIRCILGKQNICHGSANSILKTRQKHANFSKLVIRTGSLWGVTSVVTLHQGSVVC